MGERQLADRREHPYITYYPSLVAPERTSARANDGCAFGPIESRRAGLPPIARHGGRLGKAAPDAKRVATL